MRNLTMHGIYNFIMGSLFHSKQERELEQRIENEAQFKADQEMDFLSHEHHKFNQKGIFLKRFK